MRWYEAVEDGESRSVGSAVDARPSHVNSTTRWKQRRTGLGADWPVWPVGRALNKLALSSSARDLAMAAAEPGGFWSLVTR